MSPESFNAAMPLYCRSLARTLCLIRGGLCFGILANLVLAGDLRPKGEFKLTDRDRDHWSYQPLPSPSPSPAGEGFLTIDHFVGSRLQQAGLTWSKPASKEALIRRLTFDLIGLPPTPEEIDTFVHEGAPNSYEKLIDRLLKSPHYGERWGRHWLDLVRFAETDGFEHDAVRPHSWRYRDYVIRAFNEDKPYDRFIGEQIAGDELWPAEPDALIATGFAMLGPDMVDSSDQIQRRHNTLNDITDTTALVFLGLTMGCARCHDHKFEPLSQRDYYRLQAFFSSSKFNREHPVPTDDERAAYDQALERYNAHPEVRALAQLEAPIREILFQKKLAKLPAEAREAHLTAADQRTAEQANLVLETEAKVKVADKDVTAAMSESERQKRKSLLDALKPLPKPGSLPMAMVLNHEKGKAQPTYILRRGEYSMPLDEVSPGFPEVISAKSAGADRTSLAQWIASPTNPLTARVMVNRIWQHHFGRGLVASPSDFGVRGVPPTHPELLDWLASEFIASGWSIKHMHKLMLMSQTYQQASASESKGKEIDPENHLLWRMNKLRLEGEAIRDSLLQISGGLNPQMGGPGVFPPIPAELFEGSKGWTPNDHERDYSRRSVYIFARRNLRFPFLEVFDSPDTNLSCPIRERSTTAPQALTLLNAHEVLSAADALAKRLRTKSKESGEQIDFANLLILGRHPTAEERGFAHAFLKTSPLDQYCRALFNLNAFVYVE